MPRLLIVCTIYETIRAFLLPFARHFRGLGWQVDAAARGISSWESAASEFDQVHDIGWSRSPVDPRNFLRAAPAIREAVRRGGYDIVHVHTPVAAFVTRAAIKGLRRSKGPSLVYTAHGFHFHPAGGRMTNLIYRSLETLAAPGTDHLIVINSEDHREARRLKLLPEERISFLPGIGVDTEALAPGRIPDESVRSVRAELRLHADQPLFLMIAGFDKGKRHSDLLAAFTRMTRSDAVLALAGVGPLMESTRELARSLGISDRVRFLGYRSDVPVLMRSAVATVLTSEREGLSRSVLESLSLQVPVIGTSARGVGELLRGGGGVEVPIGDVARLAEAMDRLAGDPGLASRMGELGRATLTPYDERVVIHRHEQIYGQLMGKIIHSEVTSAELV